MPEEIDTGLNVHVQMASETVSLQDNLNVFGDNEISARNKQEKEPSGACHRQPDAVRDRVHTVTIRSTDCLAKFFNRSHGELWIINRLAKIAQNRSLVLLQCFVDVLKCVCPKLVACITSFAVLLAIQLVRDDFTVVMY